MKKILLSTLTASLLLAGKNLPEFEIVPKFGGIVPEDKLNLEKDITYGLGLGKSLSENIMLNLSYLRIDNMVDKNRLNSSDMSIFTLNPEFYFFPSSIVAPYLTAGVGFQKHSNEVAPIEDDFLMNYGLGLKFLLGTTDLKMEIKHLITFDESHEYILYTLGVSLPIDDVYLSYRKDSDGDKIVDAEDRCPDTPQNVKVDSSGCPLDDDNDGVPNYLDDCPDTASGIEVDSSGCPLDDDGDGVPNTLDKCPNTPAGTIVNADGCPIDDDNDGVPNYLDKCPDTPEGVEVDSDGCPLDDDNDGVPNYLDKCPNTPKDFYVNDDGCMVGYQFNVRFKFDSSRLLASSYESIREFASFLRQNSKFKVQINGYTDSIGSEQYNLGLSNRRAKSVYKALIEEGVSSSRLTYKGFGEAKAKFTNRTEKGRSENRRVDAELIFE